MNGIVTMKEEDSRRAKVVFFFSLILAFSFDWSIMYFCALTLASFLVYYLINPKNNFSGKLIILKKISLVGIIAFIILSFQFIRLIQFRSMASAENKPSAFNIYRRPFDDLFSQSARPLSYFLPAASHPVLGGISERFIGTKLYGESLTEHTLYLGWVPLILAFVAFKKWKRKEG